MPPTAPSSAERYRALFETMEEGFCIIEFFDGPHGPLSDYIHVEANPAYERNASIPNVVGRKLRKLAPMPPACVSMDSRLRGNDEEQGTSPPPPSATAPSASSGSRTG